MIFCYDKETAGNEIVEEIRKLAKEGVVEITKDDCISIKAKIANRKRLDFSIQTKGIIIQGKEICLGNYYKNIKSEKEDVFGDGELLTTRIYADEIQYTHLSIDKTSIDFKSDEFNLDYEDDLSFEVAG